MIEFFNRRLFIIFIFPLLLGGLTVLSFQPFNFFFVNFISLSSLFFLINYVKKKSKSIYRAKPFYKNLFILGTSYGFGFFFFGIYWIVYSLTFDDSFKVLIPFALILIPLFLSLFFSLPIVFVGKFLNESISSIFLISLTFSVFDFFRSTILTGFPWNLWVHSFSWSLEVLQILPITGTFALNLLVITIFFFPSIIFFKKKGKYLFLSFFTILFFANYFYGSYKINSVKYEKDKNINFKIVSAHIDLLEFQDKEKVIVKLIKYSNPDKDKATIFVWPEGVLMGEDFDNLRNFKPLFKENFSENHLVILGINTKKKKTDTQNTKYFNSMVIVDNNLNIISQYDKKKLVPFGEFLPFENFLEILGLKKITYGYSSFSPGKGDSIIKFKFDSQNLNILPLICYEIIFPNITGKSNNKFDFILNISEDAWFGESIGPYQHFSKAIFRAIESKTFTIRSANKGISAFINPSGKVLKSLDTSEAGNIEMSLPIIKKDEEGYRKSLIFLLLLITFIFTFFILKKFKL